VIAVDSSALMAIATNEPQAAACVAALAAEDEALISAGTLAEVLVVAARRGIANEMADLLEKYAFTVVSLTAASARRVADAYARWGKGVHPAGLNLGDCFAYELAQAHSCPLLYVGKDFARTDLPAAL
jgi:ribonuclease VapC